MRNFASFNNFTLSTTETFNIEGGAADPVFGDSTITLNEAPIWVEDESKVLKNVQTLNGNANAASPAGNAFGAKVVKVVTTTARMFTKGRR
jgi:hypothetical protein